MTQELPAKLSVTILADDLAFTPVPRRVQAGRNTITADRQRAFIAALAQTGSVALASKVIGNADKSLYALKLAPGAESFAAAWDRAVQIGARQILDILVDHAINGTPEYIYKDGELIAERRRFNHRMMMWIVTHAMPEHFGLASGLVPHGATSSGLRKLKAKWEAEWLEAYKAEQSAIALAKAEADAASREAERQELLPAMLVRLYQKKVREERRYRLSGRTLFADHALRSLVHLELYMELKGLVEPEIIAFFDGAQADPHPWETEASRAIEAHRKEAWTLEAQNSAHPELVEGRPPFARHSPGTTHAFYGGPTHAERTKARQQAERQMAEAQALWEACATEESWEKHPNVN